MAYNYFLKSTDFAKFYYYSKLISKFIHHIMLEPYTIFIQAITIKNRSSHKEVVLLKVIFAFLNFSQLL